jgi:predicted nucleic acid-binding protein
MGKIVVIDTNILVGPWQNKKETLDLLPDFQKHKVCISVVTYVEFLAAAPKRLKRQTRKFLQAFEVVSFNAASIQAAKTFAYDFETAQPNFMDLLIAANVHGIKAEFYTFNKKDFKKFGVL